MNGYYDQVDSLLKQNGFSCIRQKGSHQIWCYGKKRITVSMNCSSRHTANAIMKQAGIKHKF